MKPWMTALVALAATMTITGCAAVLDPLAPVGTSDAIALLAQDLPPPTGHQQDLGGAFAPDSLALMWSNQPELCSDPQIGATCADTVVWQGILVLPPDLVQVGTVDLSDPRIWASDAAFGNDVCAGGGSSGNAPGGTMEILSTDATSITVNLIDGIPGASGSFTYSDGMTVDTDVTIKGTFTLPRCEAAPAPSSP